MPTDPDIEQRLDQIIDAALPGYAAAEPEPGLEHRILARAFAEPRRNWRLRWQGALAIPALASLLIFLTLRGHPTPPGNTTKRTASTQAAATTAPVSGSNLGAATTASSAHPKAFRSNATPASRTRIQEALPKQETFPSPSPLTAEEQTLLAYNRAQLQATILAPSRELDIDPIRIGELRIEPLADPILAVPTLDSPTSSSTESSRNDPQSSQPSQP